MMPGFKEHPQRNIIPKNAKMRLNRTDSFLIFMLLGLLAFFYPGLVVAREASLMGDHWEQHYPWAFVLAKALPFGPWPFWTPLIQCGFPIVAESQMGLFYLPNIILYGLLPIQVAYAYMNLVHFFISALGTYLYCRSLRLVPVGAFVAAIVFVFGTGYGGAYYNITSLKTLSWFPMILWSFEEYCASYRKRYLVAIGLFTSFSILAGYLQIAALMLLFLCIYFCLRVGFFFEVRQDGKSLLRLFFGVIGAFSGAVILALPQLMLTSELAMLSNRTNLTEDYAYVGSLSPLALMTLIFPKLQGIFRGNCLYSGIFSIYFVCASLLVARKDLRRVSGLWLSLGIISLLLALGQWSPLYIALIKISHFYSFRVPAKFLIFFCFSVAVLAGLGSHAWSEELAKVKDKMRLLCRFYLKLVAGIFAIWGIAYFFVTGGSSLVLKAGQWVVVNFIYGKAGHPRTLESYFETVSGFVATCRDLLSIDGPWQLWALALILGSGAWAVFARRLCDRPGRAGLWLILPITVLLADLYVFAGADIKLDFDAYHNVLKPDAFVQTLLLEKKEGRLGRLYGLRKESEDLPLKPSVNMLYGIEDIGGYSPLIMQRYFESIGQFGNVNDSNRMIEPTVSFVLDRLPLLSGLGVSHVLSTRELRHSELELLRDDPQRHVFLYRNKRIHDRAFFVGALSFLDNWSQLKEMLMLPGFDPRTTLLLETREQHKIPGIKPAPDSKAISLRRESHGDTWETWELETSGPGFFVITNTLYPGWKAQLDGRPTPILSAFGLFQAVWIPGEGKHRLAFDYQPFRSLIKKQDL